MKYVSALFLGFFLAMGACSKDESGFSPSGGTIAPQDASSPIHAGDVAILPSPGIPDAGMGARDASVVPAADASAPGQ